MTITERSRASKREWQRRNASELNRRRRESYRALREAGLSVCEATQLKTRKKGTPVATQKP